MARRFRFRLDAVLRVRRITLESRQRVVAERLASIRSLQEQGERVRRAIENHTASARAALSSESLPVEQVIWDRQQLARLRREWHEAAAALDQQHAALIVERRALVEAHRAVRSLERLEEKQREAHRVEIERAERREEDDRATLQFGRSALIVSEPA